MASPGAVALRRPALYLAGAIEVTANMPLTRSAVKASASPSFSRSSHQQGGQGAGAFIVELLGWVCREAWVPAPGRRSPPAAMRPELKTGLRSRPACRPRLFSEAGSTALSALSEWLQPVGAWARSGLTPGVRGREGVSAFEEAGYRGAWLGRRGGALVAIHVGCGLFGRGFAALVAGLPAIVDKHGSNSEPASRTSHCEKVNREGPGRVGCCQPVESGP